jgi:hypothetical protein
MCISPNFIGNGGLLELQYAFGSLAFIEAD